MFQGHKEHKGGIVFLFRSIPSPPPQHVGRPCQITLNSKQVACDFGTKWSRREQMMALPKLSLLDVPPVFQVVIK